MRSAIKTVFWTWHGYHVYEVLVPVTAYRGPAQDQVSQIPEQMGNYYKWIVVGRGRVILC